MPRFVVTAIVIMLVLGFTRAEASTVVTVDKTKQRLTVAVDGVTRYEWPVSTARAGYRTPNGTYHPQWFARKWFSREYHWSPMPYSIFFEGGYAIHGSYETSHLGRPASHGCIRLRPANAAILFAMVKKDADDTQIVITGNGPKSAVSKKSRLKHRRAAAWRDGFEDGFAVPFPSSW